MWVPELTQKPEAKELCVSVAQFPAKNFTIRQMPGPESCGSRRYRAPRGTLQEVHTSTSSGEGHSQLTSWDPRPCTKTRQETQTSFLSDRHIMLNQVLEIRSHSQKSQRIMIVWHLYQKCEVKHSEIHPSGVPCLQSKSRAVVPVDTEYV